MRRVTFPRKSTVESRNHRCFEARVFVLYRVSHVGAHAPLACAPPMPTVGVPRDPLLAALGNKAPASEQEFQDLCFEFGIELDDVETPEKPMTTKTRGETTPHETQAETVYKIEVPANRYDLLCLEGLKRALAVFLQVAQSPKYSLVHAPSPIRISVQPSVDSVRPFIVGAVLRNCTFDDRSYNSFLDLQEKLHHNIARRRTLVAIGTHDLDTLSPPFNYQALPPPDIKFVPLAQTVEFSAHDLFKFYDDPKNNSPLRKFLHIIKDSPVYPVVSDSNGVVCSLPPIINGEHSRISPATKNVFIECTCTDLTKGHMVLNTLVAMFSEYCAEPFTIEPVQVVYQTGKLAGRTLTTPDIAERTVSADLGYIRRSVGLDETQLPSENIPELLKRMMLDASLDSQGKSVQVRVPITRPDVMHACDVMEDVAVSFSFNKLPRAIAPVMCSGSQQPLMKLAELLRIELSQMGFTEALTFALCSTDDNFSKMRRPDDDGGAVILSNPKTEEFQICRTSLLPGLFKTLERNKSNPLPWKLFEVSDVVLVDSKSDVGAANQKRLAVVTSDSATSGFEIVHGVVDRVLLMLGPRAAGASIVRGSNPSFLEGRCAAVHLANGAEVGHFGTVHPEVLCNFELDYPTAALELNLELIR